MGKTESMTKNMTGEDEDGMSNLMLGQASVSTVIPSAGKKLSLIGRLDGCDGCIRYILIVGNCFFFFLGCTVIGLGIYVVVDKVNFVTGLFGMTLVTPASYLIIASGCVIFIISFIGCFGALFESRPLLVIYSTAMSLVFVLTCVGFIFAVLFVSKVTDQIRIYMIQTLRNEYGINLDDQWNHFVTDGWDKAQTKWQCCAVRDDTWPLYHGSAWFQRESKGGKAPAVPISCCKLDASGAFQDLDLCQQNFSAEESPDVNSTELIRAINTRGCYEEGKLVMKEISGYFICIGIITAILVIGGLALSIQLTRKV